MSKYIVWNPDDIYEIKLAAQFGINLFENGEVVVGPESVVKQDSRKKIVIKNWWFWAGTDTIAEDLDWADLLICYTGEVINGPWKTYQEQTVKQFNNKNFICIANGRYNLYDYPADTVYDDLGHFFNRVVDFCYYEPWNITAPRTKIFDVLLGIINQTKPHRQFVFSQLQNNNLLDKSFVSAWQDINYTSADLAGLDDPAIFQRHDSIIQVNGLRNGYSIGHSIPIEIYNQSWYSIVTETNPSNSNFLTEKTAKPLFEKRLFIMFGSQGLLKRLRNLGYQTFGSVIDESYDDEPNDELRWQLAFEQVLALSQADHQLIYKELEPVLNHNHCLILDQSRRLQKLKNFLDTHTQIL